MILAFLLGALVTWLWSVRSVTRVIPASEYDGHLGGRDGDRFEVEEDDRHGYYSEREDAAEVDMVRPEDTTADEAEGAHALGDEPEGTDEDVAGTPVDDRDDEVVDTERTDRDDEVFDAERDAETDTVDGTTAAAVAGGGVAGIAAGSQLGDDDHDVTDAGEGAHALGDEDPDDDVQPVTREADHTQAIPMVGQTEDDVADSDVAEADDAEEPYGPGSARPAADGSGPEGWAVKGNVDSGLFHTEDSPGYDNTTAEVWFVDEESAVAAGFRHWDRKQR